MTEPSASPGAPPPRRPATDVQPGFRALDLQGYLWSNRDRYTEDALASAARSAGYTDEEIVEAARIIAVRRTDDAAAAPVKARARRYVLAAYAITFLLFAVAFLRPSNVQAMYYRGAGPFALGILGFMLLMTLLLALAWVAGQHPRAERAQAALGAMLAVPFVMLVIVAGLCFATTGPLIFAPPA